MTTINESNMDAVLDLSGKSLFLPAQPVVANPVEVYPTFSDFPIAGNPNRIYFAVDTHLQWFWEDVSSQYHMILEVIDGGTF